MSQRAIRGDSHLQGVRIRTGRTLTEEYLAEVQSRVVPLTGKTLQILRTQPYSRWPVKDVVVRGTTYW